MDFWKFQTLDTTNNLVANFYLEKTNTLNELKSRIKLSVMGPYD